MKKTYLLLLFYLFILAGLSAQGPACRNEAKIDQVQAQYGLSGNGVLAVMMDRGIDYRHPDFIDANGKTRIAYIYDLYDNSGANDPDNPFGIGTIYDSTEINNALQAGGDPITNDWHGHGTATTGILAGNGSGVANAEQFRGVAYRAKIISIVVTKDFVPPSGNNPGQPLQFVPGLLPTAFQFAEQKIAELDMPSVTLLNIGSIQDPTDGSIPLCDIISDYVDKGNTFVCGTGDDGGKDNHMIENMVLNQTSEFILQKGEIGNLRFTAWYSEDDRFDLSIERPNGQIEGPFSPPTGPSDIQDNFVSLINIFHRGANVEFSGSDANLRQLLIDIFDDPGTYKIILEPTTVSGDGKINAFLNPALFYNDNAFLNNDNPGGNIHSFSACPATLSPGDYVATNSWVDIDGVPRSKVGEGAPGELWIGSSVGPTMDGRLGIDLVAPGEIAASAYGEDSYYSSFSFNVLQNSQGNYGIQTAVSAAAPLVTGVIALMLEADPELTPQEIKTILQETAREDSFTGSTPNTQWGYGKLDALAAIEEVVPMVDTRDIQEDRSGLSLRPNPAGDYVEIITPGMLPSGAQVELYASNGIMVKEFFLENQKIISLEELPKGIYLLRVNSGSEIWTEKLVKK
jgi:minor extracellular serine protease Vpr